MSTMPPISPPKIVLDPPCAPPAPPPPPKPRTCKLRVRTGGSVLNHHIAVATEALRANRVASAPVLEPRIVNVRNISYTIYERVAQQQTAASFLIQHRALPETDLTGLKLWPCSLCMINRLLAPTALPHLAASRQAQPLRIIELGAGTGLVGLAVCNALCGSQSSADVVLTDPAIPVGGGQTTLDALRATVAANAALAPSASTAKLLWGDRDDLAALQATHGDPFDVCIGCELLYRPDSVNALARTVQALNVKVAVLAQQTRPTGNTDLEDDFIDLMQRHGYSHKAEGMGGTAVLHTFLNRGETIKNMRCGLMCAD